MKLEELWDFSPTSTSLQASFNFCNVLCSQRTLITLPPGQASFAITAVLPISSSCQQLTQLLVALVGLSTIHSYDYI